MSDRPDIEEVAAGWLIRREEQQWDQDSEAEFQDWLQQSMAHKAAFWRLEHGWREADRIGALGLNHEIGTADERKARPRHWKAWALAASIALIVSVSIGLATWRGPDQWETAGTAAEVAEYDTEVGKQKAVSLADGSMVELNTATSLRTAITPERREAWLENGEAFFDIASDKERPFVVHAGKRTITVLGTKFSVRRDGDDVTVSVVEGRVEIGDAEARPLTAKAVITAGDVAISHDNSTLFIREAQERVSSTLAWREGMLNFDDVPLGKAIAEFNRYNEQAIVIEDPHIAAMRIGGHFQATNVAAFLRLLRDAYGLRVVESDGTVKISGQ